MNLVGKAAVFLGKEPCGQRKGFLLCGVIIKLHIHQQGVEGHLLAPFGVAVEVAHRQVAGGHPL